MIAQLKFSGPTFIHTNRLKGVVTMLSLIFRDLIGHVHVHPPWPSTEPVHSPGNQSNVPNAEVEARSKQTITHQTHVHEALH